MSDPEISIITPMYNARPWLAALFETTRHQSFQGFEHVLVDDRSSDGSAEEALRLSSGDARVKVLSMPQNSGPAAARNMAIEAARGRYLAFLDADDQWMPHKLEKQLAWMKHHGHAFTYHDYRHMSHHGDKLGSVVSGPDVLTLKSLHTHRGTGGCLSVMVDRNQLPWFRFPDLQRSLPEDFLAWLAIIQHGHHGHRLPEDLGRYRLTGASRSSNKLASALAVWHLYRHVEKLPASTALSWWLQYAWNARQLYKRARPV
ncbi:MAG: glycosyltransferase family 2 protein [Burkholderiales bacterium]|nr:glycosyltransferase family 2 protein [Burkholderiales bacterium]